MIARLGIGDDEWIAATNAGEKVIKPKRRHFFKFRIA